MEADPLRWLQADRDRYNQRFRVARHQHPHLNPDVFSALLRDLLAPLAALLPAHLPDPAAQAAAFSDLYDLLLEGQIRRMLGPGTAQDTPAYPTAHGQSPLARVWRDLLPAMPQLTAAAPRQIVPLLGNAAWNLCQEPSTRFEKWIAGMKALGPLATTPDLLRRLCVIQSWRHGLAWMRPGAIQTWLALDPALQPAALGLPDRPDQPHDLAQIARDLQNPWKRPGDPDRDRALHSRSLGGFRGFGGQFLTPPVLTCDGDRFFARADGLCWSVDADEFGATLRRCPPPAAPAEPAPAAPAAPAGAAFRFDPDGTVHHTAAGRTRSRAFAALANPLSVAASPHTLMVSLPRSFKIVVIGPFGPAERPGA